TKARKFCFAVFPPCPTGAGDRLDSSTGLSMAWLPKKPCHRHPDAKERPFMFNFRMWIRRISSPLNAAPHRPLRLWRKSRPAQLQVEHLEDRVMPANLAAYGQLPMTFIANQGQT